MTAIIDARSNPKAIEKLKQISDKILLFRSTGITYESVSGHPDIFLFQHHQKLIVAPNAPNELFQFLNVQQLNFEIGNLPIGDTLQNTTLYNCLCTENYFFHKQNYTDLSVMEIVKNKVFVNLPQPYTACSLICLDENHFMTSDRGIEKILQKQGLNCFYFNPEQIRIHGHRNGFIGGTCGILDHTIYFNGNTDRHTDGLQLKLFLKECSFDIVCLADDFLYDGGKIFFL